MKREALIVLVWFLTFCITFCCSNDFWLITINAIFSISILILFYIKPTNIKIKNWLESPLINKNGNDN